MQVTTTGRIPVKSWASDVEASAQQQADNLSNLPFALHHVALMPDAHAGYGMPIGGVLFADHAVVPYAVGVDIGCGVALIETEATVEDLVDGKLEAILAQIFRDVPVGNGPPGAHRQQKGSWFQPPGPADSEMLTILNAAETQLGTLGGGNHFIEIQRDEDGRVWAMLHSGSRSVGKKTCDRHFAVAKALCAQWYSQLPDPELAFLPWDTEESKAYWNDMHIAMEWAEENRRRMVSKVIDAIGTVTRKGAWQVLDIHHNYATFENHFGKNGIIHRKGSVRAREGEMVLIPGSMGTASYVAVGLGNPQSFQSCQHGAGRARSRGETRRAVSLADMDSQMAAAGVVLVTPNRGSVTDESAFAYKDIEEVMANSADLVTPSRRLTPLGVVKG